MNPWWIAAISAAILVLGILVKSFAYVTGPKDNGYDKWRPE